MSIHQHFHACKHASLEEMIFIGQVDFDGHGSRGAIQRLHDSRHGPFEHVERVGLGPDLRACPIRTSGTSFSTTSMSVRTVSNVQAQNAPRHRGGAGSGPADIGKTRVVRSAGRREDVRIGQIGFGLSLCHFHLFDLRAQSLQRHGPIVIDLSSVQILWDTN